MDRFFKRLRVELVALGVGAAAACVLGSSPAAALQIIVGKDTNSNTPAMYTRSSNVCSKIVMQPEPGNWYIADGTAFADQILVYDTGPNLNWCGFTIAPMAAFPPNMRLAVYGFGGSDTIFGGYGGGAARVDHIYGDVPFWVSDGADDSIWAGPASLVEGSALNFKGNNVYLLPLPGVIARGRDGKDLFCTQVSNVFSTTGVTEINGGANQDNRFGPSANTEIGIEMSGGTFNRDRCDLVFWAFVGTFDAMLNG